MAPERLLAYRKPMNSSNTVGCEKQFAGSAWSFTGSGWQSVLTETDCVVYRLTAEALNRMCGADPELALAFHQFLLRVLAERLTTTSNILRGFQDKGSSGPGPV